MTTPNQPAVFIAGIYAADLVFTAASLPSRGETVRAGSFMRSHGGKGSNQAVAAARAGARVSFYTLIGDDAFGQDAQAMWSREGIRSLARVMPGQSSGAAGIVVNPETGDNAIVVYPGASGTMCAADIDPLEAEIARSAVAVVQLEQPVEAALRVLELARAHGVTTLLNPAPACPLPDALYALCDYIVPNETEAALLTGLPVQTTEQIAAAAQSLLSGGVRNVILTLGERGSYFHNGSTSFLVPACEAGPCLDTTGAGDGYMGGLATALARGDDPRAAMEYASALAGLSVTRRGAAMSMPRKEEIEAVMRGGEIPPPSTGR